MFPGRYFGARYFAPRYFAKVGATPAASTSLDGIVTSLLLSGAGH